MKNYAKAKEALFAAGRITVIGKGRISRENNAWLDEQIAAGKFTVSGLSVSSNPVITKDSQSTQAVVVKREKIADTGIADIGEPYRNEESTEAFSDNGPVGMRTVCNLCGNSLTYCYHPIPRVHTLTGEVDVSFKRRVKPLPVNPWS